MKGSGTGEARGSTVEFAIVMGRPWPCGFGASIKSSASIEGLSRDGELSAEAYGLSVEGNIESILVKRYSTVSNCLVHVVVPVVNTIASGPHSGRMKIRQER